MDGARPGVDSRIEDVKAKLTSTFGSVFKVDSTKKLSKKLAGEAARTAQWVTDVGNEYGQVYAFNTALKTFLCCYL